ncbi:MAG: SufD family Fe-S cluster assembly protein, partial [Candidatus Eremiobacteraeota bacterium]|nr:SufD family Fe-S cluster assembly protein [Candidatus Eremiobacteraeota bacterium]
MADAPTFSGFDDALLPRAERERSLARFASTRTGREKASRYWKIDLETISTASRRIDADFGSVAIVSTSPRVIACDLATAARDHAGLFRRAFRNAVEPHHKFAHLTAAFAHLGAFVYVPADCSVDEPISITYTVGADEAIFPHTVVLLERGARATIIERYVAGMQSFIAGVAEAITGEGSSLTYAAVQDVPADSTVLST